MLKAISSGWELDLFKKNKKFVVGKTWISVLREQDTQPRLTALNLHDSASHGSPIIYRLAADSGTPFKNHVPWSWGTIPESSGRSDTFSW
jgi:hypothetical protein